MATPATLGAAARARRLKNRRGAVVVTVALLATGLMMAAAVAVDASRMHLMRAQLQTAADAAALAAAVELIRGPSDIDDLRDAVQLVAEEYASRNPVMGGAPSVDRPFLCLWDASGACPERQPGQTPSAVRITLRHQATYTLAQLFRRAPIRLRASTLARAASVNETDCVKPWGIPYATLVERINAVRGLTDPTRDLTDEDIRVLSSMTEAQRTFALNYGGGEPFAPGNFGPLAVGGPGANVYLENLLDGLDAAPCDPRTTLAVGDLVSTQPGVLAGPTAHGAREWMEAGRPVKAVFWLGDVRGRSEVEVKLIGSFMITEVSPQAHITGYFLNIVDGGKIGTVATPLQRPVLVE